MEATAKDRFVSAAVAAEITGVSTVTLAQWRWKPPQDAPPPFVKIGRSVRYPLSGLNEWMERRKQQHACQ